MRLNRLNKKLNIIGKNIKKYRVLRNLTQEEVCSKLALLDVNLYRSDMYKIENNQRIVKDFEAYAFAKVLRVSIEQLYEDADKEFD